MYGHQLLYTQIPGHAHLDAIGAIVREELKALGFNVWYANVGGAVCDGIAMGHYDEVFRLASRELKRHAKDVSNRCGSGSTSSMVLPADAPEGEAQPGREAGTAGGCREIAWAPRPTLEREATETSRPARRNRKK